jgi:hypothetical protein
MTDSTVFVTVIVRLIHEKCEQAVGHSEVIIFIDFDGCLHPMPLDKRGALCHVKRVQDILRDFTEVSLVISSSWREVMSVSELVSLFPEEVGKRIVGITPVLSQDAIHLRYAEILAWLLDAGYDGDWIALDDASHEFPIGCPDLLYCNPRRGFDAAKARELRARLWHLRGQHGHVNSSDR